jgi:hypothetical protein
MQLSTSSRRTKKEEVVKEEEGEEEEEEEEEEERNGGGNGQRGNEVIPENGCTKRLKNLPKSWWEMRKGRRCKSTPAPQAEEGKRPTEDRAEHSNTTRLPSTYSARKGEGGGAEAAA